MFLQIIKLQRQCKCSEARLEIEIWGGRLIGWPSSFPEGVGTGLTTISYHSEGEGLGEEPAGKASSHSINVWQYLRLGLKLRPVCRERMKTILLDTSSLRLDVRFSSLTTPFVNESASGVPSDLDLVKMSSFLLDESLPMSSMSDSTCSSIKMPVKPASPQKPVSGPFLALLTCCT